MLQNAYVLAKIGADTAENERNFAKRLPKLATTLTFVPVFHDLVLLLDGPRERD